MTGARQDVLELERALPALREKYKQSAKTFATLPQDNAHLTRRREALVEWHSAAVEFFNAHEKLIAIGGLTGAADDAAWYTDKTDSAVNILDSVEICYRGLFASADDLKVERRFVTPGRTAFANMQRLVRRHNPTEARGLRDRFLATGLPVHGFDTEEAGRPAGGDYKAGLWERIVAGTAAAIVLGVTLFVVVRNQPFADPNQVMLLRIVLSFAVATLGAVIPGFLHVGLGYKGFAVRAGGSLALFVITYFFTPQVLPLQQ